MVKQVKIRTKMMVSFMLLVLFSLAVGYMGIHSIKQINYQNKIFALANRCLVDAQDAQACFLRFVIYEDPIYIEELSAEVESSVRQAQQAEELILSEENKKKARNMVQAIQEYNSLSQDYLRTYQKSLEAGQKRSAAAAEVMDNVKYLINYTERALKENTVSGRVSVDSVERLIHLQEIRNTTNRFRINANKYLAAITDEDRAYYLRELESEVAAVRNLLESPKANSSDTEILPYFKKSLISVEEYLEYVRFFTSLTDEKSQVQARLKEESTVILSQARQIRDDVNAITLRVTSQNTALAVILLIVSALIGVFIAIILTRSITSQLGGEPYEIVDITSKISGGNLNIHFPDRKLTGVYSSMKDMTAKLTTIVTDIISAADQVTSGSEQITSSVQEISSGTSEQAANMEEVSASIEELNSNIQQNTDNSQQSNVMAKKVAEDSQEGRSAVADTVNAMKEIAEKISVIQDIARSTNMLALNAAIEAARAGEHGKGFAVVASEVRKLAENSGAAAKDITAIAQGSVYRAIAAQEQIEQIVPAMIKTADLVEEITMASQEQNKGANQINQAVIQLDTAIQQNASASEELASMSEELLSQATSMKETIGFFKLNGKEQSQVKYLPPQTKESSLEFNRLNAISELGAIEAESSIQNYDSESYEEF